jgi:hypothetical protein
VLATVSSSPGKARRELELRSDSGVEIARMHPARGKIRCGSANGF